MYRKKATVEESEAARQILKTQHGQGCLLVGGSERGWGGEGRGRVPAFLFVWAKKGGPERRNSVGRGQREQNSHQMRGRGPVLFYVCMCTTAPVGWARAATNKGAAPRAIVCVWGGGARVCVRCTCFVYEQGRGGGRSGLDNFGRRVESAGVLQKALVSVLWHGKKLN
jgi:hypothetical protein